jgi:hypothetical protein
MSKTMDEFVVRFAGFQFTKLDEIRAQPNRPNSSVNKWNQNLRHRSKFSRVSAVWKRISIQCKMSRAAIDILRSLSSEIQAIKRNGSGWLNAFQKKVIVKSWSRDILHWMENIQNITLYIWDARYRHLHLTLNKHCLRKQHVFICDENIVYSEYSQVK